MTDNETELKQVRTSPNLIWWICVVLFFFSGLSSLIYQVVWMRTLALIFGGTTFAASTVLSVFMGGLAIGSLLAARMSDRMKNQFLWYGILEGCIGVWALLTPYLFAFATPLYQWGFQQCHLSPLLFNILRVVVASIILLPPTSCMGATLPLLARVVTARLDNLAQRVGTLYSINTFGAVVGTLLSGFFLLPHFGLQATTFISAALNLALLLTVVYLNKRVAGGAIRPSANQGNLVDVSGPIDRAVVLRMRFAVATIAVIGAISMAYEVAWTRSLLMVIGSSTYAFTLMLASFLVGIFVGGLACARYIDKHDEPLIFLSSTQIVAGVLAIIGIITFGFLPYWNLVLNSEFRNFEWASTAIRFVLSSCVMIPLTVCLGASFPAVVKVSVVQFKRVGREVGVIYAANTLGAVFGALGAGFWLLPWLGTERTLLYLAAASVVVGVGLLSLQAPLTKRQVGAIWATACCIALMAPFLPEFWNKQVLLSAQPMRREQRGKSDVGVCSYDQWVNVLRQRSKILFYKDGLISNVAVTLTPELKRRALQTNGQVDASDGADMAVQELVGILPMLCAPKSKNVAVVGWGSGVTVGATALFPLKKIEAVELEPQVVEASKFFHGVNRKPEEDARVSIRVNDGRNYLFLTDEKFDVIISEPSNLWQSGVCNLFTREYFQICRKRLQPHGLMTLWLQINELTPENVKEVLAALHSQFPHSLTFNVDEGDLVVIGSNDPIRLNVDALKEMLANPQLARALERYHIRTPEDVAGKIIMSDEGLTDLVNGASPNTDDRNQVEYEVAFGYENKYFWCDNFLMLALQERNIEHSVDFGKDSDIAVASGMANIAEGSMRNHDFDAATQWLTASFHRAATASGYRVAGNLYILQGRLDAARQAFLQGLKLNPGDTALLASLSKLDRYRPTATKAQ